MKINFLILTLTFILWNCVLHWKAHASYLPSNHVRKFKDKLIQSQVTNNPDVTSVYFEENENYTNALIKADALNEVIYALTFLNDEHEHLINSSLYYFSINETFIKKVDLFFNNESIQFSNIFVFPGLVVAFSSSNIICLSFTNGEEWKVINSSIGGKNAHYQSINKLLAIRDKNDQLYFLDSEKEQFEKMARFAYNIKWNPQNGKLYFLTTDFLSKISLVSRKPGSRSGTFVGFNVENYGFYENIVWVFGKGGRTNYIILKVDGREKRANLPTYVHLYDVLVLHISNQEILLAIKNETNSCHLFSSWTAELKFSKISFALVCNKIKEIKFCLEVEVFDAFPGLLVANIKSESLISHGPFTAISFNHGVKWTYVRGPKEVSNQHCAWPDCYMILNLRCFKEDEKSAIKYDELNPSLMVASGSIYNENYVKFNGLFVSIDAGYTWKPAPKSLTNIELLNGGSVLIGIPKILTVMLYSVDLGNTWKSVALTSFSASARAVFTFVGSKTLMVKTVAIDDTLKKWILVSVDFEKLIDKECESGDFESFTPGTHNHSQCFQGLKKFTQRKIPDVVCKVNKQKLTKIESTSCPCTEDDFGCAFGYYSKDGRCYKDPDAKTDLTDNDCKFGGFFYHQSKIRKVPDNYCTATKLWKDQQKDLCGLTNIDKGITILVGSSLKYLSLTNNPDEIIETIPVFLGQHGFIIEYAFNLLERCLYLLNETGVVEMCYHEHNEANLFLRDVTVSGFVIDEYANNMFYFNSTSISVIHMSTKHRKTLCTMQHEIRRINIVPEFGFLSVAVFENNLGIYRVYFMLMNCFIYRQPFESLESITLMAFDYTRQEHVIFTETHSYRVGSELAPIYDDKEMSNSNILDAFIDGNDAFYITKFGIVMKNKMYHINQVKAGHFHLRTSQDKTHSCKLASCSSLCLPVSSTKFVCECPDNIIVDSTKENCVCNRSLAFCSRCSINEFYCDSGKCVDLRSRCDGVNHCGDDSDERECKLICEIEEILCDNHTLCVEIEKICDGTKNCKDGKDELNCHEVSKCKADEFMCLDKSCIPKQKHCDRVYHCKDLTDEIDCDETCKYYEAKCDNNQCILHSQLCDNNFDCADLSDERSCQKQKPYKGNESCLIFCDNKCIPHSHVCDHLTDCINGLDELDCMHNVFCHESNKHSCISEFMCYSDSGVCDGFPDCSDRSDEQNCKWDSKLCEDELRFKCKTTEKCISINSYCDNNVDCPDNSDEPIDCQNTRNTLSLESKNLNNGIMQLFWSVTGYSTKQDSFVVSVVSTDGKKLFYTDKRYFSVIGLKTCHRYTVKVKLDTEKYGRYLQFTYLDFVRTEPTKLTYNYQNNAFNWMHSMPPCLPNLFYIQCMENKNIVYQNFTQNNTLILPFNPRLNCRVASCPIGIYNISCSDFSNIIYLRHYSTYNKVMNTLAWIIVASSIVGVLFCFCRKKLSKPKLCLPVFFGSALRSKSRNLFKKCNINNDSVPLTEF